MRRLDIDGLRGLAVLLVVGFHAGVSWLRGAFVAVDVFFVLSGFLIGGILIEHRNSSRYFSTFYLRRACRILPLYCLILAVFFLIAPLPIAGATEAFRWVFRDPQPFWTYATFTQNFAMAPTGKFGASGLGVTWSLAIEEQFYLLFPLLVRYVPPARLLGTLLLLALGAPAFRIALFVLELNPYSNGFLMMPGRADALMLGAAAAVVMRSPALWDLLLRNRSKVHALFCVLLIGTIGISLVTPGFYSTAVTLWGRSWLALFYCLLMLLPLLNRNGTLAAVFRGRAICRLGVISYGVYLLHQPMLATVYVALGLGNGKSSHAVDAMVTLLAFAMTVAAAEASYRWLERPILAFGRSRRY